mgnify:CR=1 FL=1
MLVGGDMYLVKLVEVCLSWLDHYNYQNVNKFKSLYNFLYIVFSRQEKIIFFNQEKLN